MALIAYCDSISLRLICDPSETVRMPAGTTFREGALAPWPFTPPVVEDRVVGRVLPAKRWPSAAEFLAAYDAAPPFVLRVRLRPLVSN